MSGEVHLAPAAQAFLEQIGSGFAPLTSGDMPTLRRQADVIATRYGGSADSRVAISEVTAGGVPCRLHRFGDGSDAVLVWLHGGGWMLGTAEHQDPLATRIAAQAEADVLVVDYRLAPEARYPAPLDDCWEATKWAAQNYADVAVGGDSAGGNLAAAVALRAKRKALGLSMQVLVYPALDPQLDSEGIERLIAHYSVSAGAEGFGAPARDDLRYLWSTYVPDPADRSHDHVAPILADVSSLPPTVMILAQHDILRDDGERYALKLMNSGVSVELHCFAGQIHGFYSLLGAMPEAMEAVDVTSAALRRAFGRSTQGVRVSHPDR